MNVITMSVRVRVRIRVRVRVGIRVRVRDRVRIRVRVQGARVDRALVERGAHEGRHELSRALVVRHLLDRTRITQLRGAGAAPRAGGGCACWRVADGP